MYRSKYALNPDGIADLLNGLEIREAKVNVVGDLNNPLPTSGYIGTYGSSLSRPSGGASSGKAFF